MQSEQQLPRLVILDLYRNALGTLEKLSRSRRDRKLHAWVMKMRDEVSDQMVQIGIDEMYGEVEETEEEKQKKADEEFFL